MRQNIITYTGLVLVVGWGFASSSLLRADQGPLLLISGLLALTVLTFPLGILGFIVGFWLFFAGFIDLLELQLFATPLCALLGYLQWFRILPSIFRR